MASHRKPGVLDASGNHYSVNDGTLVKAQSPWPGIISTRVCSVVNEASALRRWIVARAAIERLFDSCLAPEISISDTAWKNAAEDLDVQIELIKAVAQVESVRSAFDEDGHPTILFERHYFHDLTQGKYDKTHPNISAAEAGGYGKFREQYTKLHEAYLLDPSAALESASWGKFQIMGKNYKQAGFLSVEEMVAAMMQSEKKQLDAFVTFVSGDKSMQKALQEKDWAEFARRYNGPGYKKNAYDTNLQSAYDEQKRTRPPDVNPVTSNIYNTKR